MTRSPKTSAARSPGVAAPPGALSSQDVPGRSPPGRAGAGGEHQDPGEAGLPGGRPGRLDPGTKPGRGDPASSLTPPRPGEGQPLAGDEWRRQVKAATSAKNARQRRQAGRYTRIADRTPGDQFRPGMAVVRPAEGRGIGNHPAGRKLPPAPDGGDAA